MNLTTAIANARQADADLIEAMHAEHKRGTSANEIARQISGLPGYSRPNVLKLLGAEDLRSRSIAALLDAGWTTADVKVWRDSARRVRVALPDDGASHIARLNAASALVHTLRGAGLAVVSGTPGDAHDLLADGEECEIVTA